MYSWKKILSWTISKLSWTKNILSGQMDEALDMPRPSAWTKNILSWTKFKLSRTKVLSRVKKSIFCLQKSFKMKLPDWKSLENLSSIRNIHIQWLLKVKNGLFNPGQNFCPGQFQYCPGQKIFCPGRWTRHLLALWFLYHNYPH